MNNGMPSKAPARTAADVCRHVQLGAEAQKLLSDGLLPRPFLDQLIERGHHADATRFMAHALPRREAVWWACQCVRQADGPTPPARATAVLEAAEAWVADPTDEARRSAYRAAEAGEFDNAPGLIGLAVFFSGGSLTPPGQTVVPPAEHLLGDMVANAVTVAVMKIGPEKAPQTYRRFFALGLDVANGKNHWKESTASRRA